MNMLAECSLAFRHGQDVQPFMMVRRWVLVLSLFWRRFINLLREHNSTLMPLCFRGGQRIPTRDRHRAKYAALEGVDMAFGRSGENF